jgi:hypothetical protein
MPDSVRTGEFGPTLASEPHPVKAARLVHFRQRRRHSKLAFLEQPEQTASDDGEVFERTWHHRLGFGYLPMSQAHFATASVSYKVFSLRYKASGGAGSNSAEPTPRDVEPPT